MTASTKSHKDANWNLNHLERGETYLATTEGGTSVGEYLGIEALHGDCSILLRHRAGTQSIDLRDVISIQLAA